MHICVHLRFLLFSTSGKIEVEKVERDIAVVVNIVVMQCKVIGGRPRILFILIANVCYLHTKSHALYPARIGTPQCGITNFSP